MASTDYRIVDAIAGEQNRLRARIAKVVSVQADRTMTVQLAGTTENVDGVNYMDSVPPKPGSGIWVLSDGRDIFGFGAIAADGRTLSPRASRSTNQTISNAADEAITFDGAQSDGWSCWSAGSPTRLTAPVTGRYMAVANLQFEANGTGFRAGWIEKTGSSVLARTQVISAAAGSPTYFQVTTPPFDMTAGTDYIRLLVRQSSGGNLACVNSSTFAPSLSLIYLGS